MSRVMRPLQLELLNATEVAAAPAVHAVVDKQNRPTAPIRVRERQAAQLIRLLPPAADFKLRWGRASNLGGDRA
jgi:hypothetical protein